jgi:hypothetical protein
MIVSFARDPVGRGGTTAFRGAFREGVMDTIDNTEKAELIDGDGGSLQRKWR